MPGDVDESSFTEYVPPKKNREKNVIAELNNQNQQEISKATFLPLI